MTDDQRAGGHAIIHTASASAAGIGAGLAQLPCSDAVALIPIQITMVISLGAVFGVHIVEGTAKGVRAVGCGCLWRWAISQVLVG